MKAIPKPQRIKDSDYLAWILQQPCTVGHKFHGPVEAHHVPPIGGAKVGKKTDDRRAIPLCQGAHQEYHQLGRETFANTYGINYEYEIRTLNQRYDDATHVKPKRQRKPKPCLKAEHCPCGRVHKASHFKEIGNVLHYECRVKNIWVPLH